MSKSDRLNHANHNEEVCEYLNKRTAYSDWVITTAFYSALHFVEHKIFPLRIRQNGKLFNFSNFDIYYAFLGTNINKHKARAKLVEKELPEIAPNYNKLKDLSFTARYVGYKYDNDIAKDAKDNLEGIKKFCI